MDYEGVRGNGTFPWEPTLIGVNYWLEGITAFTEKRKPVYKTR